MTEPLVSVIMPAYNASKYIKEAIESVQEQTYCHWELIIVDDGSTDATASIINEFTLLDTRIKYLFQENGKQGKARNLAINHSIGEYIAFLDADDLWVKDKLQIQVDLLNNRKDIDLVFTQGYTILPNNDCENFNTGVKEWNCADDLDSFINSNPIPILSVLVKREIVINAGMFTEDTLIQNSEDYHLWIKILHNKSKILSISNRLFFYRIHESQSTYKGTALFKSTLNCFLDLVRTGIISYKNTALRNRLKWLIFQDWGNEPLLEKLKEIFREKKQLLSIAILFNSVFKESIGVKKILFHLL